MLDTSILVAAERRGEDIRAVLRQVRAVHGNIDISISAVSVVELTHGIYRAENSTHRSRDFTEDAFDDLIIHPLTFEVAQFAGRMEGQQAAPGFAIPFEDLIIGCTPSTSTSP